MVLETKIWVLGLQEFYAQQIGVSLLPFVEVVCAAMSTPMQASLSPHPVLAKEPISQEPTEQASAQPQVSGLHSVQSRSDGVVLALCVMWELSLPSQNPTLYTPVRAQ